MNQHLQNERILRELKQPDCPACERIQHHGPCEHVTATPNVHAVQPVRGDLSECEPCAQHYCCPLEAVTAERDTLQAIASAACLKLAGYEILVADLREALEDARRTLADLRAGKGGAK